MNHKIKCDIY